MRKIYKFAMFIRPLILLSLCTYGLVTTEKNAPKPHIILIIADDMGWNDVSFHGSNQIPTPNIDALAYNGVILNRHYVLPICSPSRTSLLTSRYAIKTGMQGFPLYAGEPRAIPLQDTLMPQYLQKLGYETRLIGKWHVGYTTPRHTPSRRGFDSFYGYYNGYINYYDHDCTQDFVVNNKLMHASGYDFHDDDSKSFRIPRNRTYFTDLLTNKAEEIIKNNGNKKPLFLKISHLAVHSSDVENTLEVRDMAEVNKTFSYIQDIERRKYAGMMKAMDESVGRVVQALSKAKMLENSIIVFMADNGAPTIGLFANTGSNYPLRGIKNTLFEGAVRGVACVFSPLIEKWGRISEQPMHIVDWLPTFYAAAGGNPADLQKIDGVNQWPTIVKGSKSLRSSILLNIDESQGSESAIIGRLKLIKGVQNFGEGYYGVSGENPSNPSYNVEEVLSSPAGLSISRLTGHGVSATLAKNLRQMNTVRCKKTHTYPNCSTLCLFDVFKDPCETHDLSKERPKDVEKLNNFIQQYRKELVPQTNTDVDLCSLPKYFNNIWMPWRKETVNYTMTPPQCDRPIYHEI